MAKRQLVEAQVVSSDGIPVNGDGEEYGRGWQKNTEMVLRRKGPAPGPLYVVMFDGADGAMASLDSGNPWRSLRAARHARSRMGAEKSKAYYIVKYLPEKRIGR